MKEQKLQCKLNEICFQKKKPISILKTESDEVNYLAFKLLDLKEISLELILKALNYKQILIHTYTTKNSLVIEFEHNYKDYSLVYNYLKPFLLQPTETQEALYKIFEITDN